MGGAAMEDIKGIRRGESLLRRNGSHGCAFGNLLTTGRRYRGTGASRMD